MRMIDADKLIKDIEDYRGDIFASEIVELIKDMPTIREWIPCSKRLPDIDKIVLVSQIYSWERFEDGASVTIGRLHQREENTIPYWEFQYYRSDFKNGTIMDNDIICPGSEYVIAWMPLPEPYKIEGETS